MAIWKDIVHLVGSYPLSFLPDYFLLLGIVTGVFSFRYLHTPTKIILIMLVVCLLIEIILTYYATLKQNNRFSVNLTSLIETVCLSVAYFIEIKQRRSRQVILVLLAAYLITFVRWFEWMRFDEHLLTAERLVLLIYVALHFQYILSVMRVPNIMAYTMFWISAGVMVYAAGTFFIFLFTRVTLDIAQGSAGFSWYITIVRWFTCLFYAVLAVSFYLRRREVLLQVG